MSIFKTLGDAVNVPTTADYGQEGGYSAPLSGGPTNFSLPSMSQKVAEMGSKILTTGLGDIFSKGVVNAAPNTNTTQAALDAMLTNAKLPLESLPANMMPGSVNQGNTSELKVIIRQEPEVDGGPNQVVFTVMPRIDESGNVDYEQVTPIHHPGTILKYKGTSVRSWRVAARLISRTMEEATENVAIINMIRAWRMPFYGEGTAASMPDKLGAPPPILTLSAYGPRMIGPVKCVLRDFNWTWDNTVDWIPTQDGTPFPVIMDVNLSMEESWSPSEYSGFDLVKYKTGDLSTEGAFQRVVAPIPAPAATTFTTPTDFGAGGGRGATGGPTAEELRVYDDSQFQAKLRQANAIGTETGGGAALITRRVTRRNGGSTGSF